MSSSLSKNSKILIVGGGTFGLSTAWHLVRNGYSNIKLIDRHPLPSQDSAGYDLNKIFRTEYADPLYSKLGHEARAAWLEEEVLKGCYAETGYIFAVKGDNKKSLENWQAAVDNSIKQGVKFEKLKKPSDFAAKAPVLNGPLPGWRGVYNAKAGWTHALNALKAVYADCLRLGVQFVTGPSGTMGNLLLGEGGEVLGVEAEDGTRHLADRVILACGGWMDSVIDTKGQCLAKAWCLVHIQLTEEEAAKWKGMPVINNRMLGYMFEPDAEGRQLKVAPHSVGYTHYVSPGKSFPRAKSSYPSDGIPTEAKEGIRELLRDTLPDLADRPFGYERLCWDADTPDAHFLITDHPEHRNLYIAGGASAHGFKFFPIIGNHIMQLLENRLDSELKQAWQWRPWQEIKQDTSRPDLPNVDLRDVEGWNNERVARL